MFKRTIEKTCLRKNYRYKHALYNKYQHDTSGVVFIRLELMAEEAIQVLKHHGSKGITNTQLAKKLKVPKRRVYDVIAILKATNLVSTSRDKHGICVYWVGPKSHKVNSGPNRIRSRKIKISTSGSIISVSNRGTEVIVESSCPNMHIEKM